jgi:hypothetical protein
MTVAARKIERVYAERLGEERVRRVSACGLETIRKWFFLRPQVDAPAPLHEEMRYRLKKDETARSEVDVAARKRSLESELFSVKIVTV